MREILFGGGMALWLAASLAAAESTNLLSNGGFEGAAGEGGAPAGWRIYAPNASPTIRLDAGQKVEGKQSVFLELASEGKATLVSDPIPVAPGETLRLRVQVRAEGLASQSGGSIALTAAFLDSGRAYRSWTRLPESPKVSSEWTAVEIEAKVPPDMAYTTFQIGLSAASGKTWWDKAELTTSAPVALRFNPPPAECEPGAVPVPMAILNRDPALAGREMLVSAQPGQGTQRVRLTKETLTPLAAEFSLKERGKVALSATLVDAQTNERLFAAETQTTVPPLLRTEPLVPTHFCVEDGAPRLEGRLWVHPEQGADKGLGLSCSLLKDDETLDEWRAESLPKNPVQYELKAPKAELANYKVVIELKRGKESLERAELDWHGIRREDARVVVGEDGYLRVKGEPIFPIGIFNAGRFDEMAKAGFNVTHGYNAMATRPGQVPDNTRAKKFLDDSAALGMKTLMLGTHGGHERTADDEFTRRVRMFRNHPGLLAWDEEEGIARGEMEPENLARMCQIIHREDPNHPFMLGDCAVYPVPAGPDRAHFFPDDRMDMGMWWWYPFPLKTQASADALQGQEAAQRLELTPPTFLTLATTRKPLWSGVQSYKKPNPDGRYPTPEEYRAQAYLAVIVGAKGLMYYVGGSNNYGVLNHPEEAHWDYLKTLVSELRGMAPVFMAPDADTQPKVEPPDAPISARLKATPTGKVLLAANRAPTEVEAAIAMEGQRDAAAPVRFEKREAAVKDGQLHDRFGPLAVHVYNLP